MRFTGANTLISIGFVLMWSSGFIGAKLGTQESGTYTLLMWRFILAAAILLAIQLARRALRLTPRELAVQALVGLLGQGVYLIGTVKAVELGVAAGTVALIAALQPIASAALAGPVLGERVLASQWVGLAVGLAGVALVVGADLGLNENTPWWAYGLPFLGMAGLVAATLVERRAGAETSLVNALTVQCLVSAALFTLLSLSTGVAAPPAADGFWLAVGWFIVFSTFGGYGFYWLGLRRTSVARMTSLIYLTPPTTMLWAFLMFDETVTALAITGVLICIVSVWLTHWSQSSERAVTRN
ncbi:DMT family transporter [Crossiella sp. CA-258035]|uniref:DMT family transporter n=1 Tax=Crossiella sp. CA-258035 TaxID=2981138 RepID=UPI0024BCF4D6|nr:DMT family transporter [Crossiella sp. CA-258035]WHT21744.1 DMT family transporter [Crossiella sp. CA-258035]